ncbi:hypothetical protein JYU34_004450 [Plutella xylostella]|uniref:FLYWCH-type domain-containing protein n=1 Tax=Plutella xylostella TaxID=51655 RepID=A0ABQ7QY09_PLUXY|nr:hypothetical protein JYU34_004450 [Plutella xylostella]
MPHPSRLRFETTRFGNPVIVFGRFRFNRWSGSRGREVRWTCSRAGTGCRASLITVDNVVTRTKGTHKH